MYCPECNSAIYTRDKTDTPTGVFISIRCSNPECKYFDYKTISKPISRL